MDNVVAVFACMHKILYESKEQFFVVKAFEFTIKSPKLTFYYELYDDNMNKIINNANFIIDDVQINIAQLKT